MPFLDLGSLDRIDLRGPTPQSPEVLIAICKLVAYMRWPLSEDDEPRRQFLAKLAGLAIAAVEDPPPPANCNNLEHWLALNEAVRQLLYDYALLPLGGLNGVLAGQSLSEVLADERSARGQNMAGWILIYMRRLADHFATKPRMVSVSRAIYLVEAFTPYNHRDAWESWERFGRVSHICATSIFHTSSWNKVEKEPDLYRDLGFVLGLASDFQQFGLAFKAHGQRHSLLDPEKAWLIPGGLRLPDIKWPASQLPADILKVATEYHPRRRAR